MSGLLDFFIRLRVRWKFWRRLGYFPNFRNPQSYCEKIQWLQQNHSKHNQKMIQRADKYAVRNFIEEKGYGDNLVHLYGAWDGPEEIDWDSLPSRFVLKLNNASGKDYRWFVPDKSCFDTTNFLFEAKNRMKRRYGYRNGEYHYSRMRPKIIAEQYLHENQGPIKDYKFYCFHGTIAFFSVELKEEGEQHVRDYFDVSWARHPVAFYKDVQPPAKPFEKPENFEMMVKMAEDLSDSFPHVRVDLYNVSGQVYFGELTYTPEAGITRWKPVSLDFEYGRLMRIEAFDRLQA